MNRLFLAGALYATAFAGYALAQGDTIPTLECVERANPVMGNTAITQDSPAGATTIAVSQAIPYSTTVTINPGGPTQETLNGSILSGGPPYYIAVSAFQVNGTQYAHAAGEVIAFSGNALSAGYFGYMNVLAEPSPIAAGSANNFFLPGNPNRGQPSSFAPGAHRRTFSVAFESSRDLTWVLEDQAAVARLDDALYCDAAIPTVQVGNKTLGPGTMNSGLQLGSASWGGGGILTPFISQVFYGADLNRGALPSTDVTFANLTVQNGIVTGDVTVSNSALYRVYGYTLGVSTDSGVNNFSTGYIEVVAPCNMTVTPASLPSAVVGVPYATTFSATGGPAPITYAVEGALPIGLSLTGASLSGTPQQSGSYPFLLRASGVDSCFQRTTYTLTVLGPSCASDVTSQVQLTLGGFRQNLATKQWQQTVTLRNAGSASIAGPIALALGNLSANAALIDGSGVTACAQPLGRPYILVSAAPDGSLAAGATATVTLNFTNATAGTAITYTPAVLAGGSSR